MPLKKKLAAEFLGTFCLIFTGTGAIIIDQISGGTVSHAGVALVFGLIILAMIYTLGDISGAHLNPAVTLGFMFSRRIEARSALPYIFAQCSGALCASTVLRFLFPFNRALGATLPSGSNAQSFVLEFLLTAILMFVILGVSTGAQEKDITAGIAIGATIGLEALFAGPISGASMNPARSLAPALISWNIAALWIYLLAPPLGAWCGVLCCRAVREDGCCL